MNEKHFKQTISNLQIRLQFKRQQPVFKNCFESISYNINGAINKSDKKVTVHQKAVC